MTKSTLPMLNLADLGLGHLAGSLGDKASAKNPATQTFTPPPETKWRPVALVCFWVQTKCLACGSISDSPKYRGQTIFIKGQASKKISQDPTKHKGSSARYKHWVEYRTYYGGFPDLPRELETIRDTIQACRGCFLNHTTKGLEILDEVEGYTALAQPYITRATGPNQETPS